MILNVDHMEDDPTDPAMVIVYAGWGGPNQLAARVERASILVLSERPSAFVEYQADQP